MLNFRTKQLIPKITFFNMISKRFCYPKRP